MLFTIIFRIAAKSSGRHFNFVLCLHFNFFSENYLEMISLEDLKKELDERIINPDFSDLINLTTWFTALKIKDILSKSGYENDNYCRVSLISRKEYELLLCCWQPGQKSAFHGHPNQGCLVKILTGILTEEVRFSNGESEIRLNKTDDVGYINDKIGFHRVENASSENAVSLHLYAPGGYIPQPMTFTQNP